MLATKPGRPRGQHHAGPACQCEGGEDQDGHGRRLNDRQCWMPPKCAMGTSLCGRRWFGSGVSYRIGGSAANGPVSLDRKSTRLNSSHPSISYAVFCLKKKIEPTVTNVSECLRHRTGGRGGPAPWRGRS